MIYNGSKFQIFLLSWLSKSYRGSLSFYKDCYNNEKYRNPAYCEMCFRPRERAPFLQKEAGPQPARVKLKWDESYGGKEEDIAPIVAACLTLNLTEYIPKVPAQAK